MIRLTEIQDYVQNTAKIISSVLDMQVIITDNDRFMVGDSNPNPEFTHLESASILNVVMENKSVIVLECREDNPGCIICNKRHQCLVESIIGYPILYKNRSIGAIGIMAASENAKRIMIEKKEYFLEFTHQMSELLLSKLMERESNIQLQQLQKQLSCIINSIEYGILATDESGRIIFHNMHARDFFDQDEIGWNNSSIYDLLDESYTKGISASEEGYRNKESLLQKSGKSIHTLISGRPIIMDRHWIGSVFILKRLSDVYKEVVELSVDGILSSFDSILGNSSEILEVKQKAARIARGNSTVLIQGESGTGKELFARAIHNSSSISDKPFVAVNCAAIPDNLLESELFGYEEGSFTGAKKSGKLGKFQLADGGTIFLDEIGEMPLPLQAKILRVLQERCVERIGSSESTPIDVRVIAATNKNLEDLVKDKEFREDLYYRLNVIPLYIPPLRKRPDDIKALLYHFLSVYNSKLDRNIKGYSTDVEQMLISYGWKGNVRELQNVVEYAVNMTDGEFICTSDINVDLQLGNECTSECAPSLIVSSDFNTPPEKPNLQIRTMDEILKMQILDALRLYGTTVEGRKKTAQGLGISIATLYRKMKQFEIK